MTATSIQKKNNSPEEDGSNQPKVLIEPKKTNLIQDELDFSFWERLYGIPLNELERSNITTRLGGFFNLLKEIDER